LKTRENNSLTTPNPLFKLGPLELEPALADSTILFSLRLLLTLRGEHFFAGVAQLVEQLIRNQQVRGSSPRAGLRSSPTNQKARLFSLAF
jgi:hypothetical protein